MADHKKTQPETVLDRRDALGLAAAVAAFGLAMGMDISGASASEYKAFKLDNIPDGQTQHQYKEPTTRGTAGPVQQKDDWIWIKNQKVRASSGQTQAPFPEKAR